MKLRLRTPAASAALTCAALGCGFQLEVNDAGDAGSVTPDASRSDAGRAGLDSSVDATGPTADADAPPLVGALRWAPAPKLDVVSDTDGPLRPDRNADGVFEVEVQGAVVALALLRTDAAGAAVGGQQWDTYVDADVWPEPLAPEHGAGRDTYQLGVIVAGAVQNGADGRCALGPGMRTLQLAAHDVGSFVSGASFRLVVESTARGLVRGPILTLP